MMGAVVQESTLAVRDLEPEFRNLRTESGEAIDKLYCYKGL